VGATRHKTHFGALGCNTSSSSILVIHIRKQLRRPRRPGGHRAKTPLRQSCPRLALSAHICLHARRSRRWGSGTSCQMIAILQKSSAAAVTTNTLSGSRGTNARNRMPHAAAGDGTAAFSPSPPATRRAAPGTDHRKEDASCHCPCLRPCLRSARVPTRETRGAATAGQAPGADLSLTRMPRPRFPCPGASLASRGPGRAAGPVALAPAPGGQTGPTPRLPPQRV